MEKQLLAIQVKQPFLTRSVNAILSLYKDPESKAHFMEASLTSDWMNPIYFYDYLY